MHEGELRFDEFWYQLQKRVNAFVQIRLPNNDIMGSDPQNFILSSFEKYGRDTWKATVKGNMIRDLYLQPPVLFYFYFIFIFIFFF